jgi:diaminopimelate decarboxylase
MTFVPNPDVLRYPKTAIKNAVDSFPTPFFVYEEKRIRQQCQKLKTAFEKYFDGFTPLFAVKSNPNPHVLQIIHDEGFGMDCSSESEVWITSELGATGMHTGNYTLKDEYEMVLNTEGMLLNLDDISALDTVRHIKVPEFISFRINTGFTKGSMKSNEFAGENAKYGIRWEDAVEAYTKAKNIGVKRFGIHAMTGSNVLDERYFSKVAEKLWEIIHTVHKELGIDFEYMNIGGGFGVPYTPQEKSLDIDLVAKNVRRVFDSCSQKYKIPKLMVEPGRWIACDAGFLVGTVHVIKQSYKKFVGLDTSTNQMPRTAFYGAYHHISVFGKEAGKNEEVVNVVGRICENNDQFAVDRMLPRLEIGDRLIIHNCGAHAFVMGHNYNGRLRPAEYLLMTSGEFIKIRESETIADLFSHITPY